MNIYDPRMRSTVSIEFTVGSHFETVQVKGRCCLSDPSSLLVGAY